MCPSIPLSSGQQMIALIIAACIVWAVPVRAMGQASTSPAPTTQHAIDRVELMPNRPQPFKHKDFKTIAKGLDELLFDFDAKGKYLPLI
jgi:hypothetical protein